MKLPRTAAELRAACQRPFCDAYSDATLDALLRTPLASLLAIPTSDALYVLSSLLDAKQLCEWAAASARRAKEYARGAADAADAAHAAHAAAAYAAAAAADPYVADAPASAAACYSAASAASAAYAANPDAPASVAACHAAAAAAREYRIAIRHGALLLGIEIDQ